VCKVGPGPTLASVDPITEPAPARFSTMTSTLASARCAPPKAVIRERKLASAPKHPLPQRRAGNAPPIATGIHCPAPCRSKAHDRRVHHEHPHAWFLCDNLLNQRLGRCRLLAGRDADGTFDPGAGRRTFPGAFGARLITPKLTLNDLRQRYEKVMISHKYLFYLYFFRIDRSFSPIRLQQQV
jgi:hypothetical protein